MEPPVDRPDALPVVEDGPPSPGVEEQPVWPVWPAWYAPAGFLTAAFLAILAVGSVAGLGSLLGLRSGPGAPLAIAQVVAQDLALVLTAVAFAAGVARPRLWHFGLGKAPLGPVLRWAAAGWLAFFVFSALYAQVIDPEGEQQIVEQLGAERSLASLVLVGILVVVLAPVVEEVFFRGFFYRALRSRFSWALAAALDGVVFGVIHWTGAATLSLLPLFMVLGFIFCAVYERTGSLYTSVAIHALNNALAFATMTDLNDAVPVVLGAGMLGLCVLLPRMAPARVVAPAPG